MILVSACLAGFNCRYDGGNKENKEIIRLVKEGKAIPVCPEQLAGLPIPRKAVEEKASGKIYAEDGEEFTDIFIKGAEETLRIAKMYQCTKAILKSHSPSCGTNQVYDGSFSGNLKAGHGVTTKLLKENGIEVISEKDYNLEH